MKASIIIPVYNAEKAIQATLDSLVKQSEADFEVLLIDDCSTDKSTEICKGFCEKDTRFRLIRLATNSGASTARNLGIKKASGEYLMFIDSDDVAHVDFVKKLVDTSLEYSADITWCNFQYSRGNSVTKTDHEMRGVLDFKSYLECYTENTTGAGCLWNKAYRREFIFNNSLKIDEDRIYGEDWDFNFRIALCNPKVIAISDILYDYIQNDISVSRRYFTSDYDNYCKSHKMMSCVIKEYDLSTSQTELNCRFVYDIVSLLQKLVNSTMSDVKKKVEFKRISEDKYFNSVIASTQWRNKKLTLRQNIIVILLRLKLFNLTWLIQNL